MREFDLFIPLYYNDGKPVEATILLSIQEQLLAEFRGLTFFPQPNKGFWQQGGVTYRDEIVIYRVVSESPARAKKFLKQFKKKLLTRLKQEEIFIVSRKVNRL